MNQIKWNSKLYDDKHGFVSANGEALFELLSPEKGQRILDLGCGTGHNAAKINDFGAAVIGIDSSEEMIRAAKLNYPHIHFEIKDGADFQFDEPFDAIFSNATLHWILEKENAIRCMYDSLKPGGKLVAEFGGKGNIELMIMALKNSLHKLGFNKRKDFKLHWYFPSIGEYAILLEKQGFQIKYALHFERPTELTSENGIKDWFRMFGGKFLEGLSEAEIEQVLEVTQASLKEILFTNGKWYADYKRLRIVAIKE